MPSIISADSEAYLRHYLPLRLTAEPRLDAASTPATTFAAPPRKFSY